MTLVRRYPLAERRHAGALWQHASRELGGRKICTECGETAFDKNGTGLTPSEKLLCARIRTIAEFVENDLVQCGFVRAESRTTAQCVLLTNSDAELLKMFDWCRDDLAEFLLLDCISTACGNGPGKCVCDTPCGHTNRDLLAELDARSLEALVSTNAIDDLSGDLVDRIKDFLESTQVAMV